MQLLPVLERRDDNSEFISHPDCQDTIYHCLNYFEVKGYHFPWVAYYAKVETDFVGSCGYKGKPNAGKIEISYITFQRFRKMGHATAMCKLLVQLALETDPQIIISATTLPEENYSTKILRKNGFEYAGSNWNENNEYVWEWIYKQ